MAVVLISVNTVTLKNPLHYVFKNVLCKCACVKIIV